MKTIFCHVEVWPSRIFGSIGKLWWIVRKRLLWWWCCFLESRVSFLGREVAPGRIIGSCVDYRHLIKHQYSNTLIYPTPNWLRRETILQLVFSRNPGKLFQWDCTAPKSLFLQFSLQPQTGLAFFPLLRSSCLWTNDLNKSARWVQTLEWIIEKGTVHYCPSRWGWSWSQWWRWSWSWWSWR